MREAVEFLLDLVGASFDVRDPREFIGFEELGTPGRCAGDEVLEQSTCPISDPTSDPPRRH